VLLLQEVGDHEGRPPTIDHAAFLADELRMDRAVAVTLPRGPYGYGNCVLARGAITVSERFDLTIANNEPRCGLRAVAELSEVGRALTVVVVHLGLRWAERRLQVDRLLADDGPIAGAEGPIVVGGDFNDWPPGPTTRLLGRKLLDAAWPNLDFRGTFPSPFPFLRLDRLYATRGLHVRRYHVHRSKLARVASDHLPIVVDYSVEEASS
jgi:endonuclease/exonuclease/phosphatase family metal-dependent hydrolase